MQCKEKYKVKERKYKMIDRIEFSNSIENLNEDNIISLFNPVMTLYGLVGAYENISISKDPSSEVASFDITFEADNNGVADKLVSQCNGSRIEVLESKININCNKESETLLHIQLIQEV